MGLIRVFWRGFRVILHLLLVILLTPFSLRRDRRTGLLIQNSRLTRWWYGHLCNILSLDIRIHGPLPQEPCLLVANHISWLDIAVIGSLVQTSFLSKAEIKHWPILGWLAGTIGTLFIRRGAGQAGQISHEIAERLSSGHFFTIFPEGRTTTGDQVRPFFYQLFSAVIESRARIVPVALHYHVNGGIDRIVPYVDKQHIMVNLYGLLQRPRSAIEVTFCPAIQPETDDRRGLAEQTRQAILEQLPHISE